MNIIKEISELIPEKVIKGFIGVFAVSVTLALLQQVFIIALMASVLPRFLTNFEMSLVVAIYIINFLSYLIQAGIKIGEIILKERKS